MCRPAQPAIADARAAGVPVMGELELASRWLRGRIVAITGTKGKSTTTTLTGRMLEAGGHHVLVGGNIGLALSAQVDDSTEDTIHVIEASSFQLEGVRDVPSVDRGAPQLLARPPRSARRSRGVRRGEGAHFREPDRRTTGRCSTPTTRRRRCSRRTRARGGCCSRSSASCREGIVVAGDAIVRRTGGGEQVLVPLSAVKLLGRHLLADVAAAAAVASLAGVEPDGDDARGRGLHAASSTRSSR